MFSLLSEFPTIPSDLLISNYPFEHVASSSDFMLICEAVDICEDIMGLMKIGDIMKEMFFFDVIGNNCISGLIVEVLKKIIDYEAKDIMNFVTSLIKMIFSCYTNFVSKAQGQAKDIHDQADKHLSKKKSL